MNATHFEFNGISSKDVGIRIASISDMQNGEYEGNSKTQYNTSKPTATNKWNMFGVHSEEPIAFSFQIIKSKICDNTYIKDNSTSIFTPDEQAYYKRWLERTDGYKYLRFFTDGYEHIYFHCTLQVQWYGIANQCIGATIQVTCDSTTAYSDIQAYETSLQNNDTFKIYNDADGIGQTDMDLIEIEVLKDGDIDISNDLYASFSPNRLSSQNHMVISNCVKGEVIIINGFTKQIASNKEHEYLADDYNYSPICLVNFDEQEQVYNGNYFQEQKRVNVFKNNGTACNINLT